MAASGTRSSASNYTGGACRRRWPSWNSRSGTTCASDALWVEVKRHFSNLIEGLPDNEFCKTFFSSVTRQLFGTVGVSPDIEFVATDLDPLAGAKPSRVTRVYRMQGDLTLLIRKLLESQPIGAPWADLDTSAWVVASALERVLWQHGELRHIAVARNHRCGVLPVHARLSGRPHGRAQDDHADCDRAAQHRHRCGG